MRAEEFDEKYKDFLEEGHYGLDIHIFEVIEYLDKVFEDLVKYPDFQYSQIKEKFGSARVYTNIPSTLGRIIESGIEKGINDIFKKLSEN